MKIWWTLFSLASGLFLVRQIQKCFFWPLNDLEQLTTENKSGFFYRQGGPYATETDLNARDSHESRLHCTQLLLLALQLSMEVYKCKINQRFSVRGPYSNLSQQQVTAPQVNSAFALLDGQVYCVFQGTAFEAELPIGWLSIRDSIPTSKRNLIIFSTPSPTLFLISQCSIKDNLPRELDDHRLAQRGNYYPC